jgi:hypothetical protein
MADATQTSFPVVPAIGNYGDIADGFDTQSESLGAGVTIPFGRAVVSHSVEGQCDLPASSSEVLNKLRGVAVKDETRKSGTGYSANEAVRVMTRGRIYVQVEETVATDDPVYVRHTANGGNTTLGIFRNDDDSGNAELFPGKFVRGGTTTVPAVLEVNFPGVMGPTGATGATGPTGPTGPQGDPG